VVRKAETFPPGIMGHIRNHGCRDLLVYCSSGRCHQSATLSGDGCPTPYRIVTHVTIRRRTGV
jgi:hypothetical protein